MMYDELLCEAGVCGGVPLLLCSFLAFRGRGELEKGFVIVSSGVIMGVTSDDDDVLDRGGES